MKNPIHFSTIPLDPPLQKIYARLGYRETLTRLGPKQKDETEQAISRALSLIRLRGSARRIAIERLSEGSIALEGGVGFESRKLAGFLAGCEEVLLMGATAGEEVVRAIRESSEGSDLSRAVVLDAAASEMADAALQWIMDYFSSALIREKRRVTSKRFSAGYGDFRLSSQKLLCDLLELGSLGVSITEDFILVPEKSVTAVAGIIKINETRGPRGRGEK